MKVYRLIPAVCLALILAGCQLADPAPAKTTQANLRVSQALVQVPASLSGSTTVRTLASDSQVASSVQAYFGYAKGQIVMTAAAARHVRGIVQAIESLGLIGKRLDLSVTNQAGEYFEWKSLAGRQYTLDKYTDNTKANRSFHLDLTYRQDASDNTQASGYMTVEVAHTDWPTPAAGEKAPDWIRLDFDTSRDDSGTAWVQAQVQGYQCFADIGSIDPAAVINSKVILTRDQTGQVTAVGASYVPSSPHFVWDAYNYSGALNPGAAGETRWYLFKGVASASDKATISLAIPANYSGEGVFATDSLGQVLRQLFRDRLAGDYDFGPGVSDNGAAVMAQINLLSTEPDISASSTADEVRAALGSAQAHAPTPNDTLDYLVSMTGIANPAYFHATTYSGHTTAPDATWPAASELDSLTLPAAAEVTGMNLGF